MLFEELRNKNKDKRKNLIVIVGAGRLGLDLAKALIDRNHPIHLIEKDSKRSRFVAHLLECEVTNGDGTELETLEEAGTMNCSSFIAVTGRDQDNLVATQLAKKVFHAEKVIARANNPANTKALRTLGTDIVVSSTEIIADLIEQELELQELHLVATLNQGKASIVTMKLPVKSYFIKKTLRELVLPAGVLIISVIRNEKMIIPNGDTSFEAGDEVVAICEEQSRTPLVKLMKKVEDRLDGHSEP